MKAEQKQSHAPSRARKLYRVGLILLLSLLALEVALRIAGHVYRARFWAETASRRSFSDRDVVVLAIGESTTAGIWVPHRDSYPKQLQRMLRRHFRTKRIYVIIPPHAGQNTSQIAHKFDRYLGAFKPALVIVMAGVNNSWSLAQSNLGEFMPAGDWRTYFFRFRRWTDDIKVVRFARLLLSSSHELQQSWKAEMEGQPHSTRWPPKPDSLVQSIGPEPFIRLWRSDVEKMIRASRSNGAGVLLMTYPNYDTPPVSEFRAMSMKHSVPLVENHLSFKEFIDEGRGEEVLCSDFRHPNSKGYAIVAGNAFDRIVQTGLLAKHVPASPAP